MASGAPLSVDRIAGHTGLSADAVAILMIVAGVLVILFPDLLSFTVGILLIVLGALWLYSRSQERRAATVPPPPPPMPPTPPPP